MTIKIEQHTNNNENLHSPLIYWGMAKKYL